MCIDNLLARNRRWAEAVSREQPDLFPTLARQQNPKYLWIGCSDSRVPANEIVGLLPGELFVHRNVANLVKHVDFNCQSVVQYAVDVLGVEHIIVCGHYGCGGVKVAMGHDNAGISDYWLRSVKDICVRYRDELEKCISDEERLARMCEINVVEQVSNLANSKIVQTAWQRGQELHIHGWIYSIEDGILNDLQVSRDANNPGDDIYMPETQT
ncbi:MAG: carbonate dehydratase [Gammaproteobacteria bacterium]|jgi:carbonic anhydrase|nr:carbonate dehydratase [Gammaproteobacteria bacterium]